MRGRRAGAQGFEDAVAGRAHQQGFALDPAQARAARRLGVLAAELARPLHRRGPAPRGVHLWGPVGRGKTWLMDAFVAALPAGDARRVHSHEFFAQLHAVWRRHRDAGAGDPVGAAVEELLRGVRVVCFDELHVHDVGDATLLTRLLRELAARRTTVVATSNHPPQELLPDPLWHHVFEPGIALLLASVDVLAVDGPTDHRRSAAPQPLGRGFGGGAYLSPGTPAQLARVGLVTPRRSERTRLSVGSRTLPVRAARDGLLWWDFADLCEGLTTAGDVLALAGRQEVWVLDGVPPLSECSPDARQRLVGVVDVLADRDVALVVLAQVPLGELADVPDPPPDLARTLSRLSLLRTVGDA